MRRLGQEPLIGKIERKSMILIIQELRQISEAGHEVNDTKLEH